MREYKFRMWDKVHKEMCDWQQYKEEMVSNDFEDDDLVIMQWTGLKDVKGREIYEGDIVEFNLWRKAGIKNYVVRFIPDDAAFRGIREDKGRTNVLSLINSEQGLKVIGNIFENPELIKEEL